MKSERLKMIPPYPFVAMKKKAQAVMQSGVDIIDLGVGDPDLPTPPHIVEALCGAAKDPRNHRYPPFNGLASSRKAMAGYYKKRFGVELNPDAEVLMCIGSKEGLAHLLWAVVDPGDAVLLGDPAYPAYLPHILMTGGKPVSLPLRLERDFVPDLAEVEELMKRERPKLAILNYPNNPTGGVADLSFFERMVKLAERYNVLLCHDLAYVEVTFDGYTAPSIMQVPGAKERCLEFYSLSKAFNMTGWRIAFAVGNSELVGSLADMKSSLDTGQFPGIQLAAEAAFATDPFSVFAANNSVYVRRRDFFADALKEMGFGVRKPRGTFYLWAQVPAGRTSGQFAESLVETTGVVVTPGAALGTHGEGFIRISLAIPDATLREALSRIKRFVDKTGRSK